MVVYVVRSAGFVKIGYSERLEIRVRALITMTPVKAELVGWMPGGRDLEAHLHERFADQRFSGEWFFETPEMAASFTTFLNPEIPERESTPANPMRKGSDQDISEWSNKVRKHAAGCWPELTHRKRIDELAGVLGWNRGRVKDLYYADRRISLRAFEQEELARWLALLIAPELRDDP